MSAENRGLVFEIQKMSTEDGPGIRTTVFFKQCPLKCVWCHNPESILKKLQLQWLEHKCIGCKICIETCKQDALRMEKDGIKIDREKCISCGECVQECPSTALNIYGKWWELDELFHEVEKDKVYYTKSGGGITVSGGEPTLQVEFVQEFLKKCKENGISTALDTCGYTNQQAYEKLLPYVDLVLLDIKEIDNEKHKAFTGVPNEKILVNAVWLAEKLHKVGKKLWIRTPIIPGYTNTDENIRGIGQFIVNNLNNRIERWDLLSFNNLCSSKYERLDMTWALKDAKLLKKEEMEYLFEIAKSTGAKNVKWSGMTKKEEASKSAEKSSASSLPSC